jgi:hypothetical protein
LNGSSAASSVAGGITAASVTRNGSGTWTLAGSQNYTTLTTNVGTTTNVNGAFTGGTATVNANGGSTVNFGTSQTVAALNVGDGAIVRLTATTPFAEFSGPAVAAVPEPGSVGLLVVGALGLLARRRRASK